MITNHIPLGGVCVLVEPVVGEIFDCCPLAAGGPKMYEKWHFFETVDDFHDFSRSYGDKIEKSKTIVSTTDTSPNIPRKFLPQIPSSFWDPCLSSGTPYVENGQFSIKMNLENTYEEKFHQISVKLQT